MKRLTALLILVAAFSALGAEADRQRIRLRILDGNKPTGGVTAKVTFPEENRSIGTTVELVADPAGFVETDVPGHVFWVSVPEVNAEVTGKEFRFSKKSGLTKRWDLRPRDWKTAPKESER